MIKRFDSYGGFLDFVGRPENFKTEGGFKNSIDRGSNDTWAGTPKEFLELEGQERLDALVRRARTGSDEYTERSAKLLDALDNEIESPASATWQNSVAGAFPCVPEAICGFPEPMRCKQMVENDCSPVRLYASLAASCGFTAEEMEDRAVAILALVAKISSLRPIEINVVWELDGYKDDSGETFIIVPLECQPMDISRIATAMCSPWFTRCLGYGAGCVLNQFSGGWAEGHEEFPKKGSCYSLRMAEVLELAPTDLWIPSIHWRQQVEMKDPIAWVNKHLSQYLGENTE